MKKCIIIGVSDSRSQWFPPEINSVISAGKVFSGGRRHHEIMQSVVPDDAIWIDITVPLKDVFRSYEAYDDIIVFASGDPLFYGFANTVMRECPDVALTVYPSFNSLQMLAHRLKMPYHDMLAVSLTGRPWNGLDNALIGNAGFIGCLTDKHKTPHDIHHRMMEYGYDNYEMYVGENLGNEEKERYGMYDETMEYDVPNCVILRQKTERHHFMGIPDDAFHLLNGRAKMITKMPVRLATLATMELYRRHTMWDIGFCTGSISIEARLQYPHLHITAFEIREEGRLLMEQNSRKFHAPGINAIISDFTNCDVSCLESPDAVFVGGYGGKMECVMRKVHENLKAGGVIVFNSVSEDSRNEFRRIAGVLGMTVSEPYTIKINDNNPITILKAE